MEPKLTFNQPILFCYLIILLLFLIIIHIISISDKFLSLIINLNPDPLDSRSGGPKIPKSNGIFQYIQTFLIVWRSINLLASN